VVNTLLVLTPVAAPNDDSITASDAPSRLLFHRPDLAAHRKQRKMARKLSEWTGHNSSAVDILAGCLAVLPEWTVEDLVTRLVSGVEAAAAADRKRVAQHRYPVEAALTLGWSLLGDGPQKRLVHILAMVGGGPLSPALLRQAAAASPGELDDVVRAGFCSADSTEHLRANSRVVAFVAAQPLQEELQERLELGLVQAVRTALLDTDHEGDQSLELAWQEAWRLCSGPQQQELRASISHRAAGLLRMRGEAEAARLEVEKALAAMAEDGACPPGLEALLLLDRATLRVEQGEVVGGLAELDAVIESLDSRVTAGDPAASGLLRRARLIRAQAAAFFMRSEDAADALQELLDAPGAADAGRTSGPAPTRRMADDPRERATLAQFEGLLMLRRGKTDDARGRLDEARRLAEAGGEGGRSERAALAVSLARAHGAGGEREEAEELLEQARVESGGDLDRKPVVTLPLVLHELGVSAASAGRLPAAATFLDEAAMLAASALPADHPTRLHITYSRGLVYLAGGQLEQARDQFERVIERADPGVRGQHYVALLARAGRAVSWYIEGAGRERLAEAELEQVREGVAGMGGPAPELLAEVARIRGRYAPERENGPGRPEPSRW